MIWVTGAFGQLGQEITRQLSLKKIEWCGTGADVDVTDEKKIAAFLKAQKKIDWIINCAAYTDVEKAEREKERAFLVNKTGAKNLSLCAKKIDAKFIHISTDYIFDGNSTKPYSENDKSCPLGIYGLSKKEGEVEIEKNLEKYYIIRTSWLYGRMGKNFIYKMTDLFKKKNEVKVVNDQLGCPTNAKNLSKIISLMIEKNIYSKEKNPPYGIYNFSDGGQASWYDFAKAIYLKEKKLGIIKKNVEIIPCSSKEFPSAVKRPPFSLLSKEKICKALDITLTDWKTSLNDFMENDFLDGGF